LCGGLAIAHNGNLVNAQELRDELGQAGAIFQSNSDTEVIVHLIARAREPRFDPFGCGPDGVRAFAVDRQRDVLPMAALAFRLAGCGGL